MYNDSHSWLTFPKHGNIYYKCYTISIVFTECGGLYNDLCDLYITSNIQSTVWLENCHVSTDGMQKY